MRYTITAVKSSSLNKLFYRGVAMRYKLSLLVVFFALTACGLPSVHDVRYTIDTYEPTTNVEVLRTWPLDRKYIEIAELEVSAGDQANNALLEEAKEIGADAILIEPPHIHSRVSVPIGNSINEVRSVTFTSIRAIAIKFVP